MTGSRFESRRRAFEKEILPGRLLKGMMTFHVVVFVVDVGADAGVVGSNPVAVDVAGDVAGW